MLFFKYRTDIIFKIFKERRSPVSCFQRFEVLFLPVESRFKLNVLGSLMRFFGMFYRNIQQLDSVRAVNVHSAAVGLLLKIIFHFKSYDTSFCNRRKSADRREVTRMNNDVVHFYYINVPIQKMPENRNIGRLSNYFAFFFFQK